MAGASSQFSDLAARAATGLVMAAVSFGAIWLGGVPFLLLVALSVAAMFWELARMSGHPQPHAVKLGAMASVLIVTASFIEPVWGFAILALPVLFGLIGLRARRLDWALMGYGLLAAALVAIQLRAGGGLAWMLWLILLVVATDIFGYFAGRLIGGRKFWPSISPKKTWAGIIAGWVAAGIVGALFIAPLGMGEGLILVSIFMSFASQLGDIAESAIKRRAGVKDSSSLLPGHGGLLDRLDGVIGAILVLGVIAALTNFGQAPI